MDLKDELKALAKEQGITFKELAAKAGVKGCTQPRFIFP